MLLRIAPEDGYCAVLHIIASLPEVTGNINTLLSHTRYTQNRAHGHVVTDGNTDH